MKELVFSRNITGIDYNLDTSILTVSFKGGIVKKYSGVPNHIYDALLKADNKNRFYEHEIDGKYTIV